jgi:hypothetical protein
MVKRRLFEAIGGFTEAYFMYSEDIDLSYKLREAGYVVHVLNDCCVIHHGGKSSSHQHDNFANLAQLESLAIFFARTRGSLYCLGYRISMAGLSIARILLIVFLMLSGRKSIQGSASGTVLRKWINVFRWAVRPERSSPVCSAANMATGQK